ncbi:MAG: hypothetical protein AB8C84_06845 [Oligoflexales bacterium]
MKIWLIGLWAILFAQGCASDSDLASEPPMIFDPEKASYRVEFLKPFPNPKEVNKEEPLPKDLRQLKGKNQSIP